MSRKIIHIDMDCFYAAVEMRDNPKLNSCPVAVGGDGSQRGVLCTCNYLARSYGVRSAMPTRVALNLCPDLVIIKPNIKRYKEISSQVFDILAKFSLEIEPLSLDEAYLDVTNSEHCQGSATWIAQTLRRMIYQKLGLTASAGVAQNKFLAKIASEMNKPNGLFVIHPDDVTEFLYELPVTKISGVGPVMAKQLHAHNLFTCQQLQQCSLSFLVDEWGKFGAYLYDVCRGVDKRPVHAARERKSVSVEHTFVSDIRIIDDCFNAVGNLFEQLAARYDALGKPEMVKSFVKIKFEDFRLTSVEAECQQLRLVPFLKLLEQGLTRRESAVRLIGIGVRLNQRDNRQQLNFNF